MPQSPAPTAAQLVNQLSAAITGDFKPKGLLIDLFLTDKIRAQITQGEFVNFSLLIDKEVQAAYTLRIEDNGTPRLVVGSQHRKKLLTWDSWASAWNIFQAFFFKAHPEAALHLAKHFAIVCQLQSKGQGWRFYDSNFCMLVAKGLVKWGENQAVLHDEARHMTNKNSDDTGCQASCNANSRHGVLKSGAGSPASGINVSFSVSVIKTFGI
ncbi:hypothetical protein BaRGS_00023367 [Batillaria attramentaria]|uniref:Uncharacterized protein n=1 Tax=Batillaria attramentaria TaxID=370345 RepID=A0ABD0KE39_9CAEN